MMATMLSMDGHDVRTAANGPAALEIITHFDPHVAFLDIGLPGRSGYELARRIRAEPRLAGITLIAVTGWGQDEDRRQSKEAGMDLAGHLRLQLFRPVQHDDNFGRENLGVVVAYHHEAPAVRGDVVTRRGHARHAAR